MSSLTLKEQLEALSLGSSKPANSEKAHKSGENRSKLHSASVKSKPAWLEQAQYGVELLKAYFPACFKELKDIKPLKVGIKQDLIMNLSTRDDIVVGDKACMVSSLAYYVSSGAYHKNVLENTERIDLEGNPAGIVSAEEAKYSQDCRKMKQQKQKKKIMPPA